MPINNMQRGNARRALAPAGEVPTAPIEIYPTGSPRYTLMTRLGVSSLPAPTALKDEDVSLLLSYDDAHLRAAFNSMFCVPPSFASEADRQRWITNNPWCPAPPPWVPPSPIANDYRAALQVRLGVSSLPPESVLPQSAAQHILASGNDAQILADFRAGYCTLPQGGINSQSEADNWNKDHPWCQQYVYTGATVVPPTAAIASQRALLQAQLNVSSLPPESVLPETEAGRLVALPDAQRRSEFARQYCSVPADGFTSQTQVDQWNQQHPWCQQLASSVVRPMTLGERWAAMPTWSKWALYLALGGGLYYWFYMRHQGSHRDNPSYKRRGALGRRRARALAASND